MIAFLVGTPLLATVGVLTEYFEERTWPDRSRSEAEIQREIDRMKSRG